MKNLRLKVHNDLKSDLDKRKCNVINNITILIIFLTQKMISGDSDHLFSFKTLKIKAVKYSGRD